MNYLFSVETREKEFCLIGISGTNLTTVEDSFLSVSSGNTALEDSFFWKISGSGNLVGRAIWEGLRSMSSLSGEG
jgi:hypothetical protein